MFKEHKILMITIVVLILLLSIIGGFYLWQKDKVIKVIKEKIGVCVDCEPWYNPAIVIKKWNSQENKNKYQEKVKQLASWNEINYDKLAGFSSLGQVEEKVTTNKLGCSGGEFKKEEYLRVEGNYCQQGIWLEINKEKDVKEIKTLKQLQEALAPVESEKEAVAFVAVTAADSAIEFENDSGRATPGYTTTVDDGYLVQVYALNSSGCGRHKDTKVIYKVSTDGLIEKIAYEEYDPQVGSEPEICVD